MSAWAADTLPAQPIPPAGPGQTVPGVCPGDSLALGRVRSWQFDFLFLFPSAPTETIWEDLPLSAGPFVDYY